MDSSSLHVDEAAAIWRTRTPEVFTIILATVKRMGFTKSLAKTFAAIEKSGQACPSTRQLRIALVEAVDMHVEIYERVECAFHKAAVEGRIERNCVGGWINRATRRQTWKRATPRARAMAYELSALANDNSGLENSAGEDLTPEELVLLREFATRYAPVLASLSIEERMLLEAKLEKRDYAELAIAWGITQEAVKTRVFRLMERLREALKEEESTEGSRLRTVGRIRGGRC